MSCEGCTHQSCHKHTNVINKKEIITLGVSAVLFIIAVILSLVIESPWPCNIFCILSAIVVSYQNAIHCFRRIAKKDFFDEDFLVLIAIIGAFCIGQFIEGAIVAILYYVGEFVEGVAIKRSNKAVSDVVMARPDYARVVLNGEMVNANPENVNIGDIIEVHPGEMIPLDGKIIFGSGSINTSAVTGEAQPQAIHQGDMVYSGCICESGVFRLMVQSRFENSTYSKLARYVEDAKKNQSKNEKFINTFSKRFTPIVLIVGLLILIVSLIFGRSFADALHSALVMLVIACPCALVISIPLTYICSVTKLSESGILIKNSAVLDALSKVNLVVFDKTGTITNGKFTLSAVEPCDGVSRDQLLAFAALTESKSNHPIAKSLLTYCKAPRNVKIEEFEEIAGAGVIAKVDANVIIVGNESLMLEHSIEVTPPEEPGTVLYIALNNKYIGMLIFSDSIKESAADTIGYLKEIGAKNMALLSGDVANNVRLVAKKLSIRRFYAEQTPEDKVNVIKKLKKTSKKDKKVMFVGDGLNDAPVIATADVGVAMGALGSDITVNAADLVVLDDDLIKIPRAVNYSKYVRKILVQNIALILGIKGIVTILAIIGFSPLWLAVVADVGVSVLAILNSLRILGREVY